MKITLLFLLLIGVKAVFCSNENIRPQPPITTISPLNTTSSIAPTTQPTTTTILPTTASTSTIPTSSEPTPAHNTTTTGTPPTTSQPTPSTTSPAPPSTTSPQTTSAPNTTSTSTPPSSTPIPPEPKTGKWTVKNNNVTCIVADMALQLNITFGLDERKSVLLDVPVNASSTGSCDNTTQELALHWEESNVTATITITFEKNATAKLFSLTQVNITLPVGLVPDFNSSLDFFENKEEFSTPLSKSYKCAKVQQLQLTHSDNSTAAVLKISHVQFEAFREKQDDNFGSAEDCESSNSSTDVVPIAVGCVLVGLVVIVLVAYLVGRRRSQSRGYLSM